MLYEEYERKIIKRARVKRFFYHFRFLFIGATTVIVGTSGGLVGTKGLVTDKEKLNSTYTYGESYNYSSKAFMSESSYEFSPYGKDEWTTEEPIYIGKYKMRSRGENSFNSYYYGKDQVFEILPKEIEVEVKENSFTYGDIPHIDLSSELVRGDTLEESYTFKYSDRTKEVWNITPESDSLRILSKEGKDVTECYTIKIKSKNVNILKRSLSVSTGSAQKVYDGEALENKEFEIKEGSLVEGETLSLVENTSITNAGSASNKQTFKVTNAQQQDMTIHYQISLVPGTLQIDKKSITFSSPSIEARYDGSDHKFTLDEIEIKEGELVKSHQVHYEFANSEKQINAGEYNNNFTVNIFDENNVDVSENYDISCEFGTTSISKRDVSISCGSGTKTYDKKSYSVSSVSITSGSLALTDKLSVTEYSSFKDSGTYENNLTIKFTNKESGEDVSNNYNVTKESGTITINKVNLTVTLENLVVTYDGKPHKNEFAISSGELVEGDTISASYCPEFVDAGTYDNGDFKIAIKDENNLDNSKNYNVTLANTKDVLTINKRPITITSLDKEKVYDGKSIRSTFADDESYYSVTSGELAEDEYIEFSYLNDVTDVGVYPIQSEIVIRHKQGDEKDKENDTIVTKNYDINYINNNFTVNARQITIQTLDTSHIYNRVLDIPKDAKTYEVTDAGDGLVEGHKISALNISCAGINVVGSPYPYVVDLESLVIVDENNNEVTSNYEVTLINNGQLTIEKRPTTVTLEGATKVYDGTPLSSSLYGSSNLLPGDYYTFDGLPAITHVWEGPKPNNPSGCHIYMSNGEEVTSNYDITEQTHGKLKIERRPITVTTASYEKVFDGLDWNIGEQPGDYTYTETGEGVGLAPGDRLEITSMKSRDKTYFHVSDSEPNSFTVAIYNSADLDVTADYLITKTPGYIKIKPLELTYQVYGHKYVYNSLTRTIDETVTSVTPTSDYIFLTKGVMPSNYRLDVTLKIDNMKYVGSYQNNTSYNVVALDGVHTYEAQDFSISEINGMQEIVKRDITLTTAGGTMLYVEGKAFGDDLDPEDRISITSGSLGSIDHIDFEHITYNKIEDTCSYKDYIADLSSIKIYDSSNNDVTSNYNIHLEYGKVTIYEM